MSQEMISWVEQRDRLARLLLAHAEFWRPQPFKEVRPAWCNDWPVLADYLLSMSESEVAMLLADPALASRNLYPYLPGLSVIDQLCCFPSAVGECPSASARAYTHIPGRKALQIDAFVAAVGLPAASLLEWCAGKGHLGRRFALAFAQEVNSLELDPRLCHEGETLAWRSSVKQPFYSVDVHSSDVLPHMKGRHIVALHACGDLHRRLLTAAVTEGVPAIDLAPCCYQRSVAPVYIPLLNTAALVDLQLSSADLKLSVTETVTAAPREVSVLAQQTARKLAFVALRESISGGKQYGPFRPLPNDWTRLSMSDFLSIFAAREGLSLPDKLDVAHWERIGQERWRHMRCLQLVRFAFRRAIEVFLLLDLAAYLEAHSYAVTLREFCPRALTPRNFLLSARLA